jgi:hypothetical protein
MPVILKYDSCVVSYTAKPSGENRSARDDAVELWHAGSKTFLNVAEVAMEQLDQWLVRRPEEALFPVYQSIWGCVIHVMERSLRNQW